MSSSVYETQCRRWRRCAERQKVREVRYGGVFGDGYGYS